jgi:hypothetical protein
MSDTPLFCIADMIQSEVKFCWGFNLEGDLGRVISQRLHSYGFGVSIIDIYLFSSHNHSHISPCSHEVYSILSVLP